MSRRVITLIVFAALLVVGFYCSMARPLSNDEIYTQTSLEKLSYGEILTMKIAEGNVSPLFYLTQKAALDLVQFRLPFQWDGSWFVTDSYSQIWMRLMANIFMSLSVTAIFWFFLRFYSLQIAGYSFLLSLSSYMLWAHWTDARPYALWFLLSTLQILILIYILREDKEIGIRRLALVHFLLAFTVVFSALQILAASLILFSLREKRKDRYVLLTILPVFITVFYYVFSPKYSFYFSDSPLQLIAANLPKERFLLICACMMVVFLPRFKKIVAERLPLANIWNPKTAFGAFFVVVLGLTAVLAGLFIFKASGRQEGFPLSNRYFIYLTPLGIIALTLFSVEAWRSLGARILPKVGIVLVLGIFLLFRAQRTWDLARGLYPQ